MMTSIFNWADQIKPRTKKVVVGLVLFGIFIALLPENSPRQSRNSVPTSSASSNGTTYSTSQPKDLLSSKTTELPNFNPPGNVFSTTPSPTFSETEVKAAEPSVPATLPTPKIEASFNCTRAQSGIETLVCADAELAALDKKVADKYFDKLLKAPKASSDEIKNDQRDFLKFRISACQVPVMAPVTPVGKYIPCLMNVYSQRLASFEQPVSDSAAGGADIENELPWLKEKRLKGEVDHNEDSIDPPTEAPAKPPFNQQDFNACMDGDTSRCNFDAMNNEQQAIIVQGLKRNFSACMNGISYSCNKTLLTPTQKDMVADSDLKRNYSSCLNGITYSCNKSLLSVDQQVAVNKSDMQRNLNACMNGITYSCNKDWLSPQQRTEVHKKEIERNYYACMNGITYSCDRSLLTPDQLAKIKPRY